MNKTKLAIIGATGLVGRVMLDVAQERLPNSQITLYASAKSDGLQIKSKGKTFVVKQLSLDTKIDADIALMSAGSAVSQLYAPILSKNGTIVIDNSSFWRMDQSVPLVVPEVNAASVHNHSGIIANPNCSTIQAVVALGALHREFGLERLIYNTYQAVSGAGKQALNQLLAGTNYTNTVIPQIDNFLDDGYTKEEKKMINETQKIFGCPIPTTATCVRVPVQYGHCVSITAQLKSTATLAQVNNALQNDKSLILLQAPTYPTPQMAQGTDSVFVGRVRLDTSHPNSVNLWVAADNVRKGAATNAVQIAELLLAINSTINSAIDH